MLASLRLSRAALSLRAPVVAVAARRYTTTPNPIPTPTPSPPPVPGSAPSSGPVAPPPGLELLSPVWTRLTNIVIDKAEGSWIYGTDGKKYLN